MNVDFMHNQIIRDTVTERFMESFNENLLPTLIAEYGASLTDVQFYEDHLTSGLRIGGEFFYPLTVVVDGVPEVRTVKWQVSNYRNYDKFNPFSYKGRELLDFELLDFNPDFVLAAIAGRNIYLAPDAAMPTAVTSKSDDKTFLAGRYSESFIDVMASAVTHLIEEEFSVAGLATSGVMLEVRFAPGTFMEHFMDGATYRRLLIKARGCAARDLWVKWSSLNGESTYTTADHVRVEDIIFELVDNVPAKIKEKEYRYLTAEGAEKYQAAMSRKNIVEWREMMRRVIRRGEVEVLEVEPIAAPVIENTPQETVVEPACVEPAVAPAVEPELEVAPVSAASLSYDELVALIDKEEPEAEEPVEEEDEDDDLTALLRSAIGLTSSPTPTVKAEPMSFDEPEEDETLEEYTEPEDEDASELNALEPVEEEDEDDDSLPWADDDVEAEEEIIEAEEEVVEDEQDAEPTESETDRIRREIEMKIRAEMEAELRRKHEEAEALRRELEERMRAETREKELLAEAARAALLDRERAEREAEERIAREEAARREEEERRLEEERIERERLEREAEEKRRLEEEERARLEAEANAKREPVYISKTVKLLFKYQIEPSITKRIHEIIIATIKYYNKEDVYIKIKANIPDPMTLNLEFVKIPEDEVPLIVNIIKVLGRSDLGITRAILD